MPSDSEQTTSNWDSLFTFYCHSYHNCFEVINTITTTTTPPSTTRDEVNKTCQDVLEKLRYYGHVETAKQPLLIAAVLLALHHPEHKLADLVAEVTKQPLTTVAYDTVHDYLTRYTNLSEDDVATMMSQFGFLTTTPRLNQYHEPLRDTLLGWVITSVHENLYPYMTGNVERGFDVLGYVYAQTMTGDGLGLGIVLTPEHITTLITDVLKITPDDVVLDPTAGTGSFLLAAEATAHPQQELLSPDTTHKPLEGGFHGIELQDKLFTLATTNMLLRYGVSHIRHGSIFEVTPETAPTVVLLNPPYGLAKNKTMRHLSELAFIERALTLAATGGRVAALVPQSTMIGKTKDDKARKHRILQEHTLEMVITVNPNAFAGSGYSPHTVIAIFTSHTPHPVGKKVRFINFEDDGWVTSKHVGLVDDGSVTQKREYLQDVLNGMVEAGTGFMVCSEVTGEDEWHHPYFYFNDTPPSEEDFLGTVADYVSWQVDMWVHGDGHLITPPIEENEENKVDGTSQKDGE